MRASEIEFRRRDLFILGIFVAGFSCYWIDHENGVWAAARWIAGRVAGSEAPATARAIFAAASFTLILAALVRSWAAAYMDVRVIGDRKVRTERLVADGPYRYLRNPLYLGTWLMSAGIAVTASRTGFVVITIGMGIFLRRLIGREEEELRATQDDRYAQYCRAVPRWFPAIVAGVPASGAEPRWLEGIFTETMMWLFAAAMVVYAATLRARWFDGLIIAGFVLGTVARRALRRKEAGAA